ncbi:MAG: glycosyltransferase family protein [Magnetococcales bacterium]|nr:glycosyltransferase family protein [Magnetococcales bacterium]
MNEPLDLRLLALFNQGRYPELEQLAQAVTTDLPDEGFAWKMLGLALMQQQRASEALSPLQKALALQPEDHEIHCFLGLVFEDLGRPDLAEEGFRGALSLNPHYVDALNNLGNTMRKQGRLSEAATCYRQAFTLAPRQGEVQLNLGETLREMGRMNEAADCYAQAADLHPERIEMHVNLGNIHYAQHRFVAAETSYRHALTLRPDDIVALSNLGSALKAQDRPREAEAAYRQLLTTHPRFVGGYYNLGVLLTAQRRFTEAETLYRQALEMQPDHLETRWNLGLLCLALGRFQEGWPLHEARLRLPGSQEHAILPTHLPFPMWQGEDLTNKALLILPEQGFGDQIQFCRYTTRLRAQGVGRLTLCCKPPLLALFSSLAGVHRLLPEAEIRHQIHHDYWTFPLSLPAFLGTTPSSIPTATPYLHPPPERLTAWAGIRELPGMRLGLAWKGNPAFRNDQNRSLPGLSVLAPLWSVSGISFVSLQKGAGEEEATHPPPGQPLLAVGTAIRDFADTAAIVQQLDLVICSDSAVAHLVGALGKPCWVMLSWEADWRWMHHREDSPWYPGMRLFRQHRPGDWSGVVQRMQEALARIGNGTHVSP